MTTTVKEITHLGALNLRQESTKLEQYELVKLVNFDISRKPGTLTLRRGKELLYDVSSANVNPNHDEVIRQVAKNNGTRYQVAGTHLYRNGVALIRDLATERETNFQSFRPLNDTAIWEFIADDNVMGKDDGSRTYIWGLDLVPLPGPFLSNQTGKSPTDTITQGTYGCAVTQIRWDTTESGQEFSSP